MKADFAFHNGTLLLYPTRKDVWRRNAELIAETVKDLSRILSRYEPTVLGVLPELDKNRIQASCPDVQVTAMQYDDIWVRDSGAIPTDDGLIKFGFNAWGGDEGLYGSRAQDSTIPEQMSKLLGKSLSLSSLTLEGGNLLTDGNGTLICIRSTIVNDNRNPGISAEEAEKELKRALGIERIIWIDEGLVLDETGGHIDNLCAFADEDTLLIAWTDDPENPNYPIVRSALESIEAAKGKKYNVLKIPLPSTFVRTESDCDGLEYPDGSKPRLPGEVIQPSYINFIFANGAVIVPTFDDPMDDEVKRIFESAMPGRKVIPFPAREVVLGGGGLHCITKNF
jgi:agmatine deiminase